MSFDWIQSVKKGLPGWKERMGRAGIKSSYTMVAASTLWPVAQAAQAGDWSALVALGTVGGNVGANLIANLIQNWKDETDGARRLAALPKEDPLRAHLDAVLQQLQALATARNALPEAEREWFVRTLRAELTDLGNWPRFEAQLTGERNLAVQAPVTQSVLTTGDGNQVAYIGSVETLVIRSVVFQGGPAAGEVSPKVLLWNYLNQVVQDTEMIDLAGVDRNAVSQEKAARLALAAVYTSLDTVRGGRPEPGEASAWGGTALVTSETGPREAWRESAISFVSQSPRAAVLGDPGSGKTTFVNFLALCLAGELLGAPDINRHRLGKEWTAGSLLPVRVVLRDFAAEMAPSDSICPGDDLWQHLVRRLGQALAGFEPLLRQHLLTEGGLLLLDGLDEVPEAAAQRARVKKAVLDFGRQFPRVRVVLTSRTYAYQRQEWRLPGFVEAVLAPFDERQRESFVDRWYAHVATVRRNLSAADAAGRATLLKQAIARNAYLSELGRRPLLLTLMASLHAWRGGALPEQREQLYEESIELLLDIWELPKTVRDRQGRVVLQTESAAEWFKTSHEKIRQALEKLACDVHRGQKERTGTAQIKETDLVSALLAVSDPELKPARVIEFIRDRAGLLLPRGEGIYALPHRTLQEYLAARHLTGTRFPHWLVELARADVERWREVVLLAGAKVARGTPYAAWVLASKLTPIPCDLARAGSASEADWWLALLAGQLLVETGIGLTQPTDADEAQRRQQVVGWLEPLVAGGHLPPVDRAQAGIILGKLGDPRPGVGLKEGLPDLAWLEIPPGRFAMGGQGGLQAGEGFPCGLIRQPYRLSRYPITVAQYEVFINEGGYEPRGEGFWTKAGWQWREAQKIVGPETYEAAFQTPNHPRVGVSWFEAHAFCQWLTVRLRAAGRISNHDSVCLPSEAEWERAARGAQGRTYPWGGDEADIAQRCNMGRTGVGHTSAVGVFPKGDAECGAADLAGNVWEWCRTLYREYGRDYEAKVSDTPEAEGARVLRGGSWYFDNPDNLRCSNRVGSGPGVRVNFVGFRCVLVSGSGR